MPGSLGEGAEKKLMALVMGRKTTASPRRSAVTRPPTPRRFSWTLCRAIICSSTLIQSSSLRSVADVCMSCTRPRECFNPSLLLPFSLSSTGVQDGISH